MATSARVHLAATLPINKSSKSSWTRAAQNAAAQLAQQILNNTNVTLKQEVIKIPEFYGQSKKDMVSAMDFITRVNACQISNNWNDGNTFANFLLCFRAEAKEWLHSTICRLCLTTEQKMWTRIRPFFKHEFTMVSYDKLIIDGLAKLSHRPNENPGAFFMAGEAVLCPQQKLRFLLDQAGMPGSTTTRWLLRGLTHQNKATTASLTLKTSAVSSLTKIKHI
jgi:hypothetical protein